METLGVVILALGFIFYISGKVASSNGLMSFGKGLIIAGILVFILFSIIDVRLQLQFGETFKP